MTQPATQPVPPTRSFKCRYCQCTDYRPCEGGCFWVLPDVCSRCAELQLAARGVKTAARIALPLDLVAALVNVIDNCGEGLTQGMTPAEHRMVIESLNGLSAMFDHWAEETGNPTMAQLLEHAAALSEGRRPDEPQQPRLWRPGDPV